LLRQPETTAVQQLLVRSAFSERLLLPLEITHGRLKECHGILEPPEASIAIVAEKTSDNARTVVVVDGQSALPPTTTLVSLSNSADGTPAILPVQKHLVHFSGTTLSPCLAFVIGCGQAIATAVCAIGEGRKLSLDLFSPTAIANHQAVAYTLVFDPVKTSLD
jgi:hypothetical protein